MRRRYIGIKSYTPFDINNYFTIEAIDDGLSVVFTKDVEFGIDGIGWQKLSANTNSPIINKGQTISFKASVIPVNHIGIGQFIINKPCNLSGNIMSLLWKGTLASFSFYGLFQNCTTIKNADRLVLPATTLANFCYVSMFKGCTSLTTAPELPATTLADNCYGHMFQNCSGLTTAPELPATTLTDWCYSNMFKGCTSLTTAPELPATTLADNCYYEMFADCTSLTTAPELPATTLTDSCYYYMFYHCMRLTTAPELPATILTKSCYNSMFRSCFKLNYIKILATDISASNCLYDWVSSVASTGTFVKNPAMNSLPTGTSGIPSGWTVVNDGEESGGDLHLILNTTNDDNIKAFQLMESEKVENIAGDFDWEPSNTTIYVSGQAGGGSFTNARIMWANQPKNNSSIWCIFFENMSEIGVSAVCFLHSNGLLEAFDDD